MKDATHYVFESELSMFWRIRNELYAVSSDSLECFVKRITVEKTR